MTVDFHSVFEYELKAINFRREHLNEGTAPSQGKDPALKQAGARAKRFLVDRAMASIVSPPSGKTRGPTKTAPESKLTGLAFSGGGMRSASFCLGVLQGLDAVAPEGQPQVLDAFDYLSTVSGGGYIGASLVAALMQGDDYDANDAIRYRLALQSQPLQPLPRCRVDLGPPVAVRQAPSGRGREHTRDQGAAFLGDLGVRHRLNGRKSSRPSAAGCCPDPAKCTS